MIATSLDVPDAPDWRHEVGYRPEIAGVLTRAYRDLRSAGTDPEGYFRAYATIRPYSSRPMSVRQRLHLEYALALAYCGDDSLPYALERLATAREIASFLKDGMALAKLSYLAGASLTHLTEMAAARDRLADALDALELAGDGGGPADSAFEVDLLTALAGLDYELGQFERAEVHLREARLVLAEWQPDQRRSSEAGALLDWIEALVAHWSGHPEVALPKVVAAADVLSIPGLVNAGRIQGMVAEIAFDFAETFPALAEQPRLKETFLLNARAYAQRALELARASGDASGAEIARLVLRNCQRIRGGGMQSLKTAEAVIRKARKLGDVALHGRALIGLGDELAARGEHDAARNQYFAASRLFEEHDLVAMRHWPNRALQRV